MVSVTVSADITLRMLLERLRWPVRLVRWRAAQEYGRVLSEADTSRRGRKLILEWLSSRTLETEVASGLAVLLCTRPEERPSLSEVRGNINAPSILADVMAQALYGIGSLCGGWSSRHSGSPPASYEPDIYFSTHLLSQVTPVLSNRLRHVEGKTNFPLMRQWAYEWQKLIDVTSSPLSGFPYYFLDNVQRQAGIIGQFSQRQDDVLRSSYLKALAYAVSQGMPQYLAIELAAEALPVNPDFVQLRAVVRPTWLGSWPEKFVNDGAAIEAHGKRIVQIGRKALSEYPISFKIPIAPDTSEHAEVRLTAVLATENFKVLGSPNGPFWRRQLWPLSEYGRFNRALLEQKSSEYVVRGEEGACLPLGLDVWPLPIGFWHHDYMSTGICLPASYWAGELLEVVCEEDRLLIKANGTSVGQWFVWHDHWTPLHPIGANPRCGMISTLDEARIGSASQRLGMRLGWVVERNVWKSETRYSSLEQRSLSGFFFDK
jgi:hypothetical protein